MLQLSLIGPPEEPAQLPSKERLRWRIRAAVLAGLTRRDFDLTCVDDITDTIVEELAAARLERPGWISRALLRTAPGEEEGFLAACRAVTF